MLHSQYSQHRDDSEVLSQGGVCTRKNWALPQVPTPALSLDSLLDLCIAVMQSPNRDGGTSRPGATHTDTDYP